MEKRALNYETPSPDAAARVARRRVEAVVGGMSIVALAALVGWVMVNLVLPVVAQERAVRAKERELLYGTDGKKLLAACREVYDKKLPGDPRDRRMPGVIRGLGPRHVGVMDGAVIVEFGGGFFHYGVMAFPPGVKGAGTKEITPGLWFYAEDGRVPRR